MDLDVNHVETMNAHDENGFQTIGILSNPAYIREAIPFNVIALGEEAAAALKDRQVKHFKLPHPSGLNRKLNDKQEISRLLYRCKKYIYE